MEALGSMSKMPLLDQGDEITEVPKFQTEIPLINHLK
jgi:hypothetical protein